MFVYVCVINYVWMCMHGGGVCVGVGVGVGVGGCMCGCDGVLAWA